MNINVFTGNDVPNILSFNNFFEKSNIFGDNGEKILGGHDHFFRRRGHTPRMNITFFSRKLDAKNLYIKQFFRKKQCFLRKLQKTVLGAHLTIF